MEKYRVTIKRRIATAIICGILFVTANVLIWWGFDVISQMGGEAAFVLGVQFGASLLLLLKALAAIMKYVPAIRHETILEELYIKETDERNLLIMQKAGSLGLNIVAIGMFMAAIISGYFNFIVFVTLLAVCLAVNLVRKGLWLYYRSQY